MIQKKYLIFKNPNKRFRDFEMSTKKILKKNNSNLHKSI